MTPGKLASLLEILRIYAHTYMQIAFGLDVTTGTLVRVDIWQDEQLRSQLISTLEVLGENCISGELPVTRALVDKMLAALNDPDHTADNGLFQQYLQELRNRMIDEIGTKLFLQVPSSKMPYYDCPRDGWEKVIERFPGAAIDVEEMRRCFALSRYAACVFHSVHVIETALIDFGAFLGVNDPLSGWTAISSRLDVLMTKTKYPDLDEKFKKNFAFLEQMQGTVSALKCMAK